MLNLLIFITILSILIVVHEFGHFLAAKQSGVKVERFSVGFGPALLKIRGKETDFWVCLFPLGGYVKLAGDVRSECQGDDFEFLSKGPGAKIKIVLAGPLFNYILAAVLFCIIGLIGFPHLDTVVGEILDNYPAQTAGMRVGDKVLKVNGNQVGAWQEMSQRIHQSKDKVSLEVERDGEVVYFDVPLKTEEITDERGRKKMVTMIGIASSSTVKIVRYNPIEAFLNGIRITLSLTVFIIQGIIFMIVGALPFKEAVAGPVGIYYITSEAVKIGLVAVIHLMGVLSLSLAIVNLLPFPLLDGGHFVIFLVEKIRRRSLSEKAELFLTRLGFIMLGTLIIFVFYNDIVRFGPKIIGKDRGQMIEGQPAHEAGGASRAEKQRTNN